MHKLNVVQRLKELSEIVYYLAPVCIFKFLYFMCNAYFLNAQLSNMSVAFACGPFSAIEISAGGNMIINFMNNFIIPLLLFIIVAIISLVLRIFLTFWSVSGHPWLSSLPLRHWEIFAYPVAATYLTSITSWSLTGRLASGTSVISVSLSAALVGQSTILAVAFLLNAVGSSRRLWWGRLIVAAIMLPPLILMTQFVIPSYFSPKGLSEVTIELHGVGLAYFIAMWLLSRLYLALRMRTNY
ncbi:MAG: hypothetical protein QW247_09575 [Pyrobaculum sp.]